MSSSRVRLLDADDRRVLALVGLWSGVAVVGASVLGLALGLAVRAFTFASGL